MAPRIPNKGEKKVRVIRSGSMIVKYSQWFYSQIVEDKLSRLCLQLDSFFLSMVCCLSLVAMAILCSLFEFSSKERQLPKRGHGQSLDILTVSVVWPGPFAAKEAGIKRSTHRSILSYPCKHSIIKKVRSEKLSLLPGSFICKFWWTREICLKGKIFFFLFSKGMSCNSYAKLTKERNTMNNKWMWWIPYDLFCAHFHVSLYC